MDSDSTKTYLVHAGHARTVKAVGSDVVDLLQRVSTQDVSGLTRGSSVFTIFTTEKGRIAEMAHILPSEEHHTYTFLLLGCFDGDFREWLSRYVILEDITFVPGSTNSSQWILFRKDFRQETTLGEGLTMTLKKGGFLTVREQYGPKAFLRILDLEGQGRPDQLLQRLTRVEQCDRETFCAARIKAGIPLPGKELNSSCNPMEALLRDHISFTKGCYVGQEVIARLDSYKKVSRLLVRLEGDGVGIEGLLRSQGKEAGVITSLYQLNDRSWRGLGYVRTYAFGASDLMTQDGKKTVRVVEEDRHISAYGGTHV